MKKNILICASLVVSLFLPMHGMDQKKLILHEATGVQYTRNNFGDIFPQWQNIPSEHLTEHLSAFVHLLKDDVKEKPFIIEVPHERLNQEIVKSAKSLTQS